MHDGELAVRLLDVRLAGGLVKAENLVVILALALLELELGVADLLCDALVRRVGLLHGLELADDLLPVARLAKGLDLGLARLGVRGIQLQRAVAVGDRVLEVFDL